ncbi:MAG TPA: aldose epimerase family protein [Rhizomicrobium sp.]|nr:aldose epimerase family protein [Rhizomicrobium sp.]
MKIIAAALVSASMLFAVPAHATIERTQFGETPDHKKVDLYTLTNVHGLVARISTYGGAVVALEVPDRNGKLADIVRGFDSVSGYLVPSNSNIGALMGRFANRIKGAQFTLEGKTYHLAVNSEGNSIHGGLIGFDKRVWSAVAHDGPSPSLSLTYVSPDGEEHYPGTVKVTVTYTLTADNSLNIDYGATTDRPTVLNLTNHSYFNLKGHADGDVLQHRMQIFANTMTHRDSDGTANGKIEPVKGTDFDFTKPTPISTHINDSNPQIAGPQGYDHFFIINGKAGTLRLGARVEEPTTGRVLEMLTTQPGVQLYTANALIEFPGKGGVRYLPHTAFCLETQHSNNSPNIPEFPSTELKPGQHFHEVTVFRFTTLR